MSEKPTNEKSPATAAEQKKAFLKRRLERALSPKRNSNSLVKHKAWSPHQIPDWEFWLDIPEVELWQACALSLNVDPDSVAPSNDGMREKSFFKESNFPNEQTLEKFNKRCRLLKANIQRENSYDSDSIGLGDFARLALNLSCPWNMPQELMVLVQKSETQTSVPALMPDTINEVGNDRNEKTEIENNESENIPGKQPRIAIGKLAVRAAIEIEWKDGKQATAKEVMGRLQTWADNATHPETLRKSDKGKRGVYWLTTKSVEKIYTLEVCEKTLLTWNLSRD